MSSCSRSKWPKGEMGLKGMVHKGKSPTRKGLPEGRNGCVRPGERTEKAIGSRPHRRHPMVGYYFDVENDHNFT